jgi:predicted TIM-barrel fold metal-dependent hydrolase
MRELAAMCHSLHPLRFSWLTTFSLAGFGTRGWLDQAVASVESGHAQGAVGVKVWKNIGMELKAPDGSFVMIDDSRFDPLLDAVRKMDMTLAAHIGEPRNCWLPVDQMTVDGDRAYFSSHPEYHGLMRPEIPGHAQQVRARDHMLQKHPGLRVVGCHFGSVEFDVSEMAQRLEQFPNLALDMAARICHLQVQEAQAVRSFVMKYQDRLLYGTDAGWDVDSADPAGQWESIQRTYTADYMYFAMDEVVDAPAVGPGRQCRGLGLPRDVLENLFYRNALRWYPGLQA